jgi:hypothetical protein
MVTRYVSIHPLEPSRPGSTGVGPGPGPPTTGPGPPSGTLRIVPGIGGIVLSVEPGPGALRATTSANVVHTEWDQGTVRGSDVRDLFDPISARFHFVHINNAALFLYW